ncbi:MAG: type IV secretory system conjugative DNA transfer family protein [Clostridiales bacterium]|nr:type IV secretory system conjugative DNA transfer family protein [Clostridiales bacterium]
MGSSENETDKYISEKLGKQTIRTMDESQSKSSTSGSISTSFKKQARDLLDAAEVAKLNNKDCIVTIRGKDPFLLKKLEFKEHPNFKKTGDYDRSKIVDDAYLEAHFKCQNKETAEEDDVRAEEEHQKEVAVDTQKKKRKGKPVRNGKEMADAIGAKEENLNEEIKKVHSVEPEDYNESAGVSASPVSIPDTMIAPVDTSPNGDEGADNPPSPLFTPAASPSAGPEDDGDAWCFT